MNFFKKFWKLRFFFIVIFVTPIILIIFLALSRLGSTETFAQNLTKLYLLFVGFAFFVLLTSLLGILDIIRVLNYLRGIMETVKKIARGNFDVGFDLKRHDEIGELARDLELMRNILKESFEELKKEEKRMNAIVENVEDAIVIIDENEKIIIFNSSAEKITGYKKEEAKGREHFQIINLFDELKQVFICNNEICENKSCEKCPINKAFKTNSPIRIPKGVYLINKYGQKIEVDGIISPLKAVEEGTINYALVFRDVTTEREIERMKSEFISITSHQLRTPLSSIRWYMEMLLAEDAGKLNEIQKDFTNEAYQSTKKAVELINNLLDVSRIEGGGIKYVKKQVQLESVIEEAISDVSAFAIASNIKIVKDFKEEKFPLLNIDAQKIYQVIQNLVVNAISYSKGKGKVVVSLEKKDNNLVFSCTDSGIGIPKDEQKNIFKKFQRGTNAVNTGVQGSGIGLYICKIFTEQMGGKIWFESEGEGKGATFYVSFPLSIV